ncbi:MAG TPA: protein kinase [Pyrinomonadaceae bacterium]|nr:protein kinase [Pyrinomonadaceae bacterium]
MKDFSRVEEIYHAALETSPEDRAVFLTEICAGDDELRREVESLLEFDGKAQDFIETPPYDLAAAVVDSQKHTSLIGKTFSHYRVLSFLGAGGMGEVYLAEDTKLGRKIALKLLPRQFGADAERRKRFEQEARAVSALNHPNIITIYGIEETAQSNFIVTEFIDGRTLREVIAEKSLSWQEAAEIAIQIAGALESAHAVNIVHRDIKPANIMIRHDGYVKILDFGLAKLTMRSDSGDVETREHTAPHRVMGTINYMSPEQALGENVDARTDIFSLGVVFYEMLSGIQPFRGASDAAVYNATLNKNPPSLNEITPGIPASLDRIIKRAIEKNPDDRYQTISELRAELQRVKENPRLGGFRFFSFRKLPRMLLPIAAAALIFVGIYFIFFGRPEVDSRSSVVRNFNYTQLTSQSGEELHPSLSPDGKSIVYSSRASGNWDIYLQGVGEATSTNLTVDSSAADKHPKYSPDGEMIAFRSEREGGGIFIMSLTGESVRRISERGYYPTWSPDGKEIAFCIDDFDEPGARTTVPSELWSVDVASGENRLITSSDAVQPSWSPNGHRIAYWSLTSGGQRDIWTVSASGAEPLQVTEGTSIDWNPVWSPNGKHLYFVSDRSGSMNLWRVFVEEETGKVLGEPEAITIPSNYSQSFSFSTDGKHLAYVQSNNYTNIFSVDFDPKSETAGRNVAEITPGSRITTNPQISPDDEWIVFDAIGDKQEDIFLIKPDGSGFRQLTNDPYKTRSPQWSPDGKRIAFFSDSTGRYEGWVINVDGSDLRRITNLPLSMQLPIWSPDGKRLLFNTTNAYPIIYDVEKDFPEPPESLPAEPDRWFMASSWSSDGAKLLGYGREPQSTYSYVALYHFETRSYEKLIDWGRLPLWLSDNRRFFYHDHRELRLFDTITRRNKQIFSVLPNMLQSVSISKDNRRIYYSVRRSESNIWLASTE